MFYFHPYLGRWSQFDCIIFSKGGLVQPPTRYGSTTPWQLTQRHNLHQPSTAPQVATLNLQKSQVTSLGFVDFYVGAVKSLFRFNQFAWCHWSHQGGKKSNKKQSKKDNITNWEESSHVGSRIKFPVLVQKSKVSRGFWKKKAPWDHGEA